MQGGLWGVIDSTGKFIAEPQYRVMGSFHEGYCPVKTDSGWGYIDTTGILVIPAEFDSAGNFSEGLAAAWKDKKWGWINHKGNFSIPNTLYSPGTEFHEERAWARFFSDYAVISSHGTVLSEYKYRKVWPFSNGVAYAENIDGQGCLVRKNGWEVFDPKYHDFKKMTSGLSKVRFDDRYGLIDTLGKVILPCYYSVIKNFSQGLAAVKSSKGYGYINETGKVVIHCQYEEAMDFSDGHAIVMRDGENILLDRTGKIVIDGKGHYTLASIPSQGLIVVEQNGKYGYMSYDGQLIIDFVFDDAKEFTSNRAWVMIDGKWGIIKRPEF
jgi:hypothetical protein